MSRAKRIDALIKLRQSEVGDIERRMLQCNLDLQAAQRQYQELTAAREEYSRRLQGREGTRISGSEVRILLVFLQRLDEALNQLNNQIITLRKAHQDCQQRWLMARNKTQAMHEIADRHRQQEHAGLMQREQRESDDRPRPPYEREQEHT